MNEKTRPERELPAVAMKAARKAAFPAPAAEHINGNAIETLKGMFGRLVAMAPEDAGRARAVSEVAGLAGKLVGRLEDRYALDDVISVFGAYHGNDRDVTLLCTMVFRSITERKQELYGDGPPRTVGGY